MAVAATRFSTATWTENVKWRTANNWRGCAYGTPRALCVAERWSRPLFVLEIDISDGTVKGAGLVSRDDQKRREQIYSRGNYNRYLYASGWRLEEEELWQLAPLTCITMEGIFSRRPIYKMGQGITRMAKVQRDNPWVASELADAFVFMFPQLEERLEEYRSDDGGEKGAGAEAGVEAGAEVGAEVGAEPGAGPGPGAEVVKETD